MDTPCSNLSTVTPFHGAADYKLSLQRPFDKWFVWMPKPFQQSAQASLANFLFLHPDSCQGWIHQPGLFTIVKTNQANISWNAHATTPK
jgi:hypothetical protein